MCGLFGFLAGLVGARFVTGFDLNWLWLTLLFAVVTIRRFKLVSLLSILLFGLVAGILRGNVYLNRLSEFNNLYETKVVLIGKATTDGVYSERSQLSFEMSDLHVIEPYEAALTGKIAIEGFGEPSVLRGDIVQVEGKLFSTLGSKQGRMSFADMKVLGRDGSVVESARRQFVANIESILPEPQASFGLGLLVGQRSTLPKDTLATLSAVGLTHIVAVSGYNLTILVRASKRFLGKRSKYQTLVGSFLLIGTFLLITGLSASIVRAAIVSGLSLLAWYYGRAIKPMLLILVSASITAGWQPTYIWSDIGWHLSFLAFFGVLVLAPLLVKRLFKDKGLKTLNLLIIESMCAWAMTAPLILLIFHEVSLVALLANVLVVPLVPFAMLFSLLAGLAGLLNFGLVAWLALPAQLLLTYMLDIAYLISKIPNGLSRYSLSAWQMTAIYSAIAVTSLILWSKTKKVINPTITDII